MINSTDDPELASPREPLAVYQKAKPVRWDTPPGTVSVRHTLYLKLPFRLRTSCTYTVSCPGLNTREPEIVFRHESRTNHCEALHVSHVGYRPDDPFKRAALSLWLGTGGPVSFEDFTAFELIDPQGQTAFTGRITPHRRGTNRTPLPHEPPEIPDPVYHLDFSAFTRPGTYRVHIPGLGSSNPFRIADDAWREAAITSAAGWLVMQTPTQPSSQSRVQPAGRNLPDVRPDASPCWAAYLQLELFDLFPEFGRTVRIPAIPRDHDERLPDLLKMTLPVLQRFVPDEATGAGDAYLYAACAARAARLLRTLDAARSDDWNRRALAAWNQAEAARQQPGQPRDAVEHQEVRHRRATAAVELLALTGQASFHHAFAEETVLQDRDPTPVIEQQGAVFAYARLPASRADAGLQQRARAVLLATADAAIAFASRHPYGLATEIEDLPEHAAVGYFTVPGMISRSLPRAHALSGESRYLAATIQSCQFAVGVNPDNVVFTTGVGLHSPQFPVRSLDRAPLPGPPTGLTVFGASDPAQSAAWSGHATPWLLRRYLVPDYREWPAVEAYLDVADWPLMNEVSLHRTVAPTAYTWGYLAARSAQPLTDPGPGQATVPAPEAAAGPPAKVP